jgi:hypothetical protein
MGTFPAWACADAPRAPLARARLDVARPAFRESHRISLENQGGGAIRVSRDRGRTWTVIGHVVRPDRGNVHLVQDKEFTASDWAPEHSVAATAVNAVHLKLQQERHATVMTLQPREFLDEAVAGKTASFLASEASIYTDIPAGTSLFGSDLSPGVGDPLALVTGGSWRPIPRGWVPGLGDVLGIVVMRPERLPECVVFENRFGGTVMAHWPGGRVSRIAQVLRPVAGVGRFGGTQYAGVGDVRANHPGVLCISTSPVGEIGGFQVVPAIHASHPDLDYVRGKPVWMVVGPAGALSADLEGTYPLFSGCFRPRVSRARVRIRNGPWVDVPTLSGLKENKLLDMTHLRVEP